MEVRNCNKTQTKNDFGFMLFTSIVLERFNRICQK